MIAARRSSLDIFTGDRAAGDFDTGDLFRNFVWSMSVLKVLLGFPSAGECILTTFDRQRQFGRIDPAREHFSPTKSTIEPQRGRDSIAQGGATIR
jgi:hypothetical protein